MIVINGRNYVKLGDRVTLKENWEYVERKKAGIVEAQTYENKGVVLEVIAVDWSTKEVCLAFDAHELDPQWEPLERCVSLQGEAIFGACGLDIGATVRSQGWLVRVGPWYFECSMDEFERRLAACFTEYGCCKEVGVMREDIECLAAGRVGSFG